MNFPYFSGRHAEKSHEFLKKLSFKFMLRLKAYRALKYNKAISQPALPLKISILLLLVRLSLLICSVLCMKDMDFFCELKDF